MSPTTIVSVIAVAGALVLAIRALRAHDMSFERVAVMAIAWILIIAVLAYVLQRYAS